MLKQFEVNIHKNDLFSKADKLLVAFSGGIDSIVLSDLLHKLGYTFDLAHCNFQLRGTEANEDTEFCKNYAEQIQAHCHITYFNTSTYAKENKLSIQMAARALRYNWFKSLIKTHGYNYVLTAHHANDNVETLFVNLIRGTGIKGLKGIPKKQNNIVRPLLFATKEAILLYAKKNQLKHREDSSNQEIKYKRNFIRHQIIPELKKLNPILEETLTTSINYFNQSYEIIKNFTATKYSSICKIENEKLFIDIQLLVIEPQKETLLFEWLHEKNFKASQIEQLTNLLLNDGIIGKQFESATHQLTIDRKYIIVKEKTLNITEDEFVITSINNTSHLPIALQINEVSDTEYSSNKNEIFIQYSDTLFPLKLRKWKNGDKFQPFGMSGFKKLSDYFKDQKLSKFEKEEVWILESKGEIVWIVGFRLDNRFRVQSSNSKIIQIKLV